MRELMQTLVYCVLGRCLLIPIYTGTFFRWHLSSSFDHFHTWRCKTPMQLSYAMNNQIIIKKIRQMNKYNCSVVPMKAAKAVKISNMPKIQHYTQPQTIKVVSQWLGNKFIQICRHWSKNKIGHICRFNMTFLFVRLNSLINWNQTHAKISTSRALSCHLSTFLRHHRIKNGRSSRLFSFYVLFWYAYGILYVSYFFILLVYDRTFCTDCIINWPNAEAWFENRFPTSFMRYDEHHEMICIIVNWIFFIFLLCDRSISMKIRATTMA